MKNLNVSGLDEQKSKKVVKELSLLLANLHVYYMNLRGLHWNVKGQGFFQLHKAYEDMYNGTAEKIDEVAERILQLDGTPENRFSELLKTATIKEDGFNPAGLDGVDIVLNALKSLIAQERTVLAAANEAEDEVTIAMMDDFLVGQEKTVWMLNAFSTK